MTSELSDLKIRYSRAVDCNEVHAECLERKQEIIKDIVKLEKAKIELNNLIIRMQAKSKAFKQRRLDVVTSETNKYLQELFPDEVFIIRFEQYVFRGKELVDLETGHSEKAFSPTEMQHGRFMRQSLGFAITSVIQELNGCNILIMDEALNSGDDESLSRISRIIKDKLDKGLQIFLIEHKHSLYENLPKKIYRLAKDTINNVMYVDEVREEVY